jgi:hypothetical protein
MNRVETPQSRCRAGVARCDVTPVVGTFHRMWGAATHNRSTGVHRPLTATVLYLQSLSDDQQPPRVLVALDHCLLWPKEMNQLLDSVCSATGLSRESLIVFFSHTHGAGLMGLERKDLPGGDLIEPYLNDLATKTTDLVRESQRRLVPASIVYGQGKCSLAQNRDYLDTERGHYVCGYNPQGVTDDTVIVGRVNSDTGPAIATFINYACHPTTLAWENTLISPDYLGAMREVVEGATNVPCLFIQGASGDIGPKHGFVGDVEVADRNGRQLGYAALSALESLPLAGEEFEYVGPVISGATLGIWKYSPEPVDRTSQLSRWIDRQDIVQLKYRNDLPSRADLEREELQHRAEEKSAIAKGDAEGIRNAHAMVERTTRRLIRIAPLPPGGSYPYPVIAWRIGDAIWLALDGEHYNLLQRTLRARFPQVPLIIGTIANGSTVWYLPDVTSYGLGLYEEEVSVLAQGCLEAVMEAATNAIQKLVEA